jgi:hypothetical protein
MHRFDFGEAFEVVCLRQQRTLQAGRMRWLKIASLEQNPARQGPDVNVVLPRRGRFGGISGVGSRKIWRKLLLVRKYTISANHRFYKYGRLTTLVSCFSTRCGGYRNRPSSWVAGWVVYVCEDMEGVSTCTPREFQQEALVSERMADGRYRWPKLFTDGSISELPFPSSR